MLLLLVTIKYLSNTGIANGIALMYLLGSLDNTLLLNLSNSLILLLPLCINHHSLGSVILRDKILAHKHVPLMVSLCVKYSGVHFYHLQLHNAIFELP